VSPVNDVDVDGRDRRALALRSQSARQHEMHAAVGEANQDLGEIGHRLLLRSANRLSQLIDRPHRAVVEAEALGGGHARELGDERRVVHWRKNGRGRCARRLVGGGHAGTLSGSRSAVKPCRGP
jgi:hypothetical protein